MAENRTMAPPTPLKLAVPGNLKVIPSTMFMTDNGKAIKLYDSRSLQRGALITFIYTEFTTGEGCRDIADDIEMLNDLFRQIGFSHIRHYENCSKEETLGIMKNLRLEGHDCVFFVVSSHGYCRDGMWDTEFRCTDGGLISTLDVVDLFRGENYRELNGTPKVFIFQMCRGKKKLRKQPDVPTDISNCNEEGGRHNYIRGGEYSDILTVYSTLPGYESPRNCGNSKLSWFIQALCSMFAAHAHDHHVIDLFRLVDEAMKQLCSGTVAPLNIVGFKDLYLHPGLAEDKFGLDSTFGSEFRWYIFVCTVLRLFKLNLLHRREEDSPTFRAEASRLLKRLYMWLVKT